MTTQSWEGQAFERLDATLGVAQRCVVALRNQLNESGRDACDFRFGCAVVLHRRLLATRLLCRGGLAHEADAVVRGLLELALQLLWAGSDDGRIQTVRNHAASQSLKLVNDAAKNGFDLSQDDRDHQKSLVDPTVEPLPSVFDVAKEVGLPGVYAVSYRRLCTSSHATWGHFEQVIEQPQAVRNTLADALFATWMILSGLSDYVDGISDDIDVLRRFLSEPST